MRRPPTCPLFPYTTLFRSQRLSAAAWLAYAEKKNDEAMKLMRAAAELEASTEKHPVTPGAIVPARELLAEMLLETGKRSEEHTSELQSRLHLVCRLLLEKK